MFTPISISFAPNFQKDDVKLAWRLLLGLEKPRNSLRQLKERLSKEYLSDGVFLYSSGRSALYYALQALELEPNTEILMQSFTCVAVPDAVIWAGLKPVFVDIDPKTYNFNVNELKTKITNKTKVVIVQHTFGFPGPIEEIKALAKKHNLIIIEDCAHAFGIKHNKKKLGTFGDIAMFSFGRDKCISSVYGGALVSHNQKITKNLKELDGKIQEPTWSFVAQQLLYLIIYSISNSFYNIGLGKALLWLSGFSGLLSRAVYNIEKHGGKPHFLNWSLSSKLAVLVNHQLDKLPNFLEHREKISRIYINGLGLHIRPKPYLRVPYVVKNKEVFLQKAKVAGFHLGNWYRGPIDPPDTDKNIFNYTPCPQAEKLSNNTINLPTHINISKRDAKKIVRFIKKYA